MTFSLPNHSLLFEQIPEPVLLIDSNFKICYANHHFEKLIEVPVEELEQKSIFSFLPSNEKGTFKKQLAQDIEQSQNKTLFSSQLISNSTILPVEFSVSQIMSSDVKCFLVLVNRDEEKHKLRREIQLLRLLTPAVVNAENYQVALETMLRNVCGFLHWEYGEAWKIHTDHLSYEAGWHGAHDKIEKFATKSRQSRLHYSNGILSRVMQGEIVWLDQPEDRSSGFPRSVWAAEAGIETVVLVPVRRHNTVLAYLAFFSLQRHPQDKEALELLASVADLLATLLHRKKLEEDLKEREYFIKHVADLSPAVISVHDIINNKSIYTNRELFATLGYSPEEIQDKGPDLFKELIHPADLPKVQERNRRFQSLHGGEVLEMDLRVKSKTGSWRWMSTRAIVFKRNEDGTPWLTLSAAIDVTRQAEDKLALKKSRKALEQLNEELERKVEERTSELQELAKKLLAQERLMAKVANSLPAFISYIDKNLVYRFANSYYRNLYGGGTELTGKPVESVVGEAYFQKNREKFMSALSGKLISFETTIPFIEGEEKAIDVKYIPDVSVDGDVRGLVVLGIDITDRVLFEERLKKQNTKLQKINSDLDNFIYIASHDLKSPVTNINGLISLLQDVLEAQKHLTPDVSEILRMMAVSTANFHKIVVDLNDINRIQRKSTNDVRDVDLKTLLSDIKGELTNMIIQSSAWIQDQVEECPPVYYSSSKLRMVIYHLITNAIQYRHPHRNLNVLVSCTELPGHYLIEVRDNGIGIQKENREKIFQMFRRYNNRPGGSGVGLYIIKRIVEDDGGHIEVESELDQGSAFKVYLPKLA